MTKAFIKLGMGIVGIAGLLAAIYFIPWQLSLRQPRSVTVTGTAKSQKNNEIATFTAGVNSVNDDKSKAVAEVNEKVTALVQSVKQFGIADKDIKTQNLNIYQTQEQYYEEGTQKQRLGQWNVGNSIEITLRDVAKAQELTDLLSKSGANNVYGPNFSLDDSQDASSELTAQAVANAREKAEGMAKASGARLGKVVTIADGGAITDSPMYAMKAEGMGGGGSPVEAGSTTVTKTVTVTFELR
jgi:uncharacterized protein YggE